MFTQKTNWGPTGRMSNSITWFHATAKCLFFPEESTFMINQRKCMMSHDCLSIRKREALNVSVSRDQSKTQNSSDSSLFKQRWKKNTQKMRSSCPNSLSGIFLLCHEPGIIQYHPGQLEDSISTYYIIIQHIQMCSLSRTQTFNQQSDTSSETVRTEKLNKTLTNSRWKPSACNQPISKKNLLNDMIQASLVQILKI